MAMDIIHVARSIRDFVEILYCKKNTTHRLGKFEGFSYTDLFL